MQPRRIARELALLSIGQLSTSAQLTESQEIEAAMTAAIRALSEEVRETLESASADLNRSSDRILNSEIQASDVASARTMLTSAIEMTQTAINRLGTTLDLPEFIQVAQTPEVREFAYSLIRACRTRRTELDAMLSQALVDWQLPRLAKIDQNILRLAVAEIAILGIPDRVAINESVELAKRYSAEDGHRFINGVLRRVTQNLKNPSLQNPGSSPTEVSTAEESVSPATVSQPENRKVIPNPGAQGTETVVNSAPKVQKEKRRVIPSPAERKAQRWEQNKPKLVPKAKKRVFDLSGFQIEQKQGVNVPGMQGDDADETPTQNQDMEVPDSTPSGLSSPQETLTEPPISSPPEVPSSDAQISPNPQTLSTESPSNSHQVQHQGTEISDSKPSDFSPPEVASSEFLDASNLENTSSETSISSNPEMFSSESIDSPHSNESVSESPIASSPDVSPAETPAIETAAVPYSELPTVSNPEESFSEEPISSQPEDPASESSSPSTSAEDASSESSSASNPEAASIWSRVSSNREDS